MPLQGNNIALGNTTNRWIASFATANTSGAFTSTGDITGVTAGTAISGGGSSGDVTVNVNVETATLLLAGSVLN